MRLRDVLWYLDFLLSFECRASLPESRKRYRSIPAGFFTEGLDYVLDARRRTLMSRNSYLGLLSMAKGKFRLN